MKSAAAILIITNRIQHPHISPSPIQMLQTLLLAGPNDRQT